MTSIKKTGDELATLLRGVAGGEALLAELKDAAPPLLRALQVVIRELRNGGKSKDTSMENVCVKQESTNFGDAATVVPAVSFSSPRGKYDTVFYASQLLLKGVKGSVVVPYSAINRVVIMDSLPKDKKGQVLVMFNLRSDSQVLNGKTRLESLLVKTLVSKAVSVRNPNKGDSMLTGPEAVVLCQLLGRMGVGGVNFFVSPDPNIFCTADGFMAVTANVKVSEGILFPLADAFCFVEKPSILLPHADISTIEFLRASGGSATFDMAIHCKDESTVEFGQISSPHLRLLEDYIASRGIQMGAPGSSSDEKEVEEAEKQEAGLLDEDSSDDEDFDPEAESSDDDEREGRGGGSGEDSEGSGDADSEEGDWDVESDDGISAGKIKERMEMEKSVKKRKRK